jgi:hypothetical protein
MPTVSLRCLLVGSESLLVACAEQLRARGHDIAGVVSDAPDIVAWCERRNAIRFPTFDAARDAIAGGQCDVLFSIGNLRIVPEDVLR